MAGQRAALLGKRFGTLEVIEELDCTRQHGVRWVCLCDCGNRLIKETRALKRGKHSSCYACNSARMSAQFTKHGDSKTLSSPRARLYKTWQSMRDRCSNPDHPAFKWYGAKGVSVCQEWQEYGAFKVWAIANGYEERPDLPLGDRPSIDRKNSSGAYCPENCHIIPHRINSRRLTFAEGVPHLQ